MPSRRVAAFGTTIFTEMSRLAAATGAVNLGQGFPDFDGPVEIMEAACDAINSGINQYAITTGAVALRAAIAEHCKRFYDQTVDPNSEVIVTSGATEAIFDTVMAYVDPGDEVVLFEPYYDSYQASVHMAGGICRYVELKPPDGQHWTWWFDEKELAAAFSERTRLVLVNTPHNPTGKVFTRDELTMIGELARRVGALMVCDEVYEHLAFAPAKHLRAATLPGFDDFTVTLSSGGKSFSFTGWKVGWAIGRSQLVAPIQKSHQWVTFATAAPFQAAIAKALLLPDSYFVAFAEDYRERRDLIVSALQLAGLEPLSPEGTYFVIARTDGLRKASETDVEFCKRLVTERGVVAIPPSVFYGPAHAPNAVNLARFAFCKTKPVLEEAARRLTAPREPVV